MPGINASEVFDSNGFVDAVWAYMNRHNLKHGDMVHLTRCNTATVSNILGYKSCPSLLVAIRFANVCDVSIDKYVIPHDF